MYQNFILVNNELHLAGWYVDKSKTLCKLNILHSKTLLTPAPKHQPTRRDSNTIHWSLVQPQLFLPFCIVIYAASYSLMSPLVGKQWWYIQGTKWLQCISVACGWVHTWPMSRHLSRLAQCPFSTVHLEKPQLCSSTASRCSSHVSVTSHLFFLGQTPPPPAPALPLKIEAAACNSPHIQTEHEAGALPEDPQPPDDGPMSEPSAANYCYHHS